MRDDAPKLCGRSSSEMLRSRPLRDSCVELRRIVGNGEGNRSHLILGEVMTRQLVRYGDDARIESRSQVVQDIADDRAQLGRRLAMHEQAQSALVVVALDDERVRLRPRVGADHLA